MSELSAVNTIWVLIGAALVFFMQAGFAMVEAGFTRAKNSGNIIMKKRIISLAAAAVFVLGTLAGCGQTGTIATDSGTTSETEANTDAEAASDTTADTAKSDEQAAADTTEAKDYGTLYVSFPTGNIRIAIDILAQQLGYFKEEGVTVEEVNLGGWTHLPQLIPQTEIWIF